MPYASLDNPQTLNLYAYVENGPLSRADADGHAGPESGPSTVPTAMGTRSHPNTLELTENGTFQEAKEI